MDLHPDTKGWATLLAPEIVTPAQWAGALRNRAASGEQRLMLAILEGAVADLLGTREKRTVRRMRRMLEAEDWIFGEPGAQTVRFEDCCAALGVDPDYLRDGLRRRLLAARATAAGITIPRREAAEGHLRPLADAGNV